jgi:hypothetical protein
LLSLPPSSSFLAAAVAHVRWPASSNGGGGGGKGGNQQLAAINSLFLCTLTSLQLFSLKVRLPHLTSRNPILKRSRSLHLASQSLATYRLIYGEENTVGHQR